MVSVRMATISTAGAKMPGALSDRSCSTSRAAIKASLAVQAMSGSAEGDAGGRDGGNVALKDIEGKKW